MFSIGDDKADEERVWNNWIGIESLTVRSAQPWLDLPLWYFASESRKFMETVSNSLKLQDTVLKFWEMCQSIYQVGDFLNIFPTVWATLEPSNPEIIHQRRYHLPSPRSLQLHNFFDLIWFNIFASSLHSILIPIFLFNCIISTASLNEQSVVLFQ